MRFVWHALLAVVVIFAGAIAWVGWYYSNQILGPDDGANYRGQRVLAHTDSTITLTPSPKALRPGRWAIQWAGGYGKIGAELRRDSGALVRRFRLAAGSPPESVAHLAGFPWDADPRTWLGFPFENVSVPSHVGALPCWLVPGSDSTWAILVHGRGVTRGEVLRMLPSYHALGLPCLVISYRNDFSGGPHVAEGGYRMGATEWADVEDAVRYALGHGARDVVMVGCSMGGGIVAQFLRHSELSRAVRCAVLDAPALDWEAVLARAGEKRGVPAPITTLGMEVTTLRAGIHWPDLTQALHAREFTTPMLIMHGDSDLTVPFAVSQRFAATRPDLVTLVRFPGADHVEGSNFEPERYQRVLTGWLKQHGVGIAKRTSAATR